MKGIKYVGPVLDFSGYSSAARDYVFLLHNAGIPLTVHPRRFDANPPPVVHGEKKEILESLIEKKINYDTVIIHLTPDLWFKHAESGKYNIGYFAWETDRLHPKWAQACESVDEIWVPCDWNIQALKNSGVSTPAYKIPHGMEPSLFDNVDGIDEFKISGVPEDAFKFYSIFQWIYRKNPEGLIRAYFNAFDSDENVALILKTYCMGEYRDLNYIKESIVNIKKDMNIGYYPKLYVVTNKISRRQLLGLHKYCDCCVSLHRGEGFGLVPCEAGLAGNPVIATGLSGNTEFMNAENSYLVDYQMTYVSGMSHFNFWYLGNQRWAECNQIHASELMRHVYENREEAKQKGLLLRKNIQENFSWEKVASIIMDRLGNI